MKSTVWLYWRRLFLFGAVCIWPLVGVGAAGLDPTGDYSGGILDAGRVLEAAREVSVERYPNADDILLDNHIFTAYEADGTAVNWDDTFIKVLTEKGMRDHQSISFGFMLPYTRVTVCLIEVYKADGTSQTIDIAAQSKEMVDRSQMEMNIYDPNMKVLQVGIPGLEVGDVLRYVIRRDTMKARVADTWSDYTLLEYTSPIRRLVYEISAPTERPLASIALKDAVPGTVSYSEEEAAGRTLHRWEALNVPRMYEEPSMPDLVNVVQRLLVSTIPDWEALSRWYYTLSEPHFIVTPQMRELVAELITGKQTEREKIEAIFQWVSQKVRYMGITVEAEAPGYEPHDTTLTFENRHGVCRDKAALLVVLLREAGFKAYPVIIHNGPKKDPEVPQPYFNHAISSIELEDGTYLLMDSTDETTKELFPAYLCNQSYLVAKPEGETLLTSPIVPASENLMRVETQAAIDEDGTLTGRSRLVFEGINDNVYRGYLARVKPEDRKKLFEGLVKAMAPGGRLTSFVLLPEDMGDTGQILEVELEFSAPEVLISDGNASMVPLPRLGPRVGIVNFILGATGLEERKYPLKTDIACGIEERLSLRLAPGLGSVVSLPSFDPVENESLRWNRDLREVEDGLELTSTFSLEAVEFAPEEYKQLKSALKTLEFNGRKQVILSRGEDEATAGLAADVEVLRSAVRYVVEDPHQWVETQEVRKRINTYKGVKDASELKLDYNPVWEEVKLVRASVRNGDEEKTISPEEINLMDAAWAASAPRYPAGKTLVASLPGVQEGSIVEYTIERRCFDRPFFSVQLGFRGSDPILEREVTLDIPADLPLSILADGNGLIEPGMGSVFESDQVEADGRVRHRWVVRDQEAMKTEADLPPWWAFGPALLISSGELSEYAHQVESHLTVAAAQAEAVTERTMALTDGVSDPRERLRLIRDEVVRRVRAAGPGIHALPLETITSADEVLASGYGNSADRAVLLSAMLREAGFEPEFVVASPGPLHPGLQRARFAVAPDPDLFPTVLVRVSDGEGHIYLNDTNQYAALGSTSHDGCIGLVVGTGVLEPIRALPQMSNRSRMAYRLEVTPEGNARVHYRREVFGSEYAARKQMFAEMPPEERRRFYQELVATVAQAAVPVRDLVTDYSGYPGREEFSVDVERYVVMDGDYAYLQLPGSMAGLLGLQQEERNYPLHRSGPLDWELRLDVVMPEGWTRAVLTPPMVQWCYPNDGGRVETAVRFDGDARRLEVRHRVELEPSVAEVEHYPELLRMNRMLNHPEARAVLFER